MLKNKFYIGIAHFWLLIYYYQFVWAVYGMGLVAERTMGFENYAEIIKYMR